MLNDFDMIAHHIPGNEDVTVIPVADVHFGALEHREQEWRAFCEDLLKRERTYIILAGDLINNATKSSVSNVYAETVRPREQKKIMAEMLIPIKDRILCGVSGNHEWRSAKDMDDDPTYDIFCKLDIEHLYRENLAIMAVKIGKTGTNGDRNPSYCLVTTHGAGGGALTGGVVNRGERFAYTIDGCDVLFFGHSHKPFITAPEKIHIDRNNRRVTMVPFACVSCASWLDYGGYAVRKMLSPTGHAKHIVTLKGNQKKISVETQIM